jgi:hypothetical protein
LNRGGLGDDLRKQSARGYSYGERSSEPSWLAESPRSILGSGAVRGNGDEYSKLGFPRRSRIFSSDRRNPVHNAFCMLQDVLRTTMNANYGAFSKEPCHNGQFIGPQPPPRVHGYVLRRSLRSCQQLRAVVRDPFLFQYYESGRRSKIASWMQWRLPAWLKGRCRPRTIETCYICEHLLLILNTK